MNAHPDPTTPEESAVGTYLRDQRRRRALSTAQVAERVGVHPHSVLRWERRERLPGPSHILGLARTLRVETVDVARFFDAARRRRSTGPERGPADVQTVRGHGLRPVRSAARVPAVRIAAAVGVSAARVYSWESGRARIPVELVPALAAALDLEPRSLHRVLATAPPARSAPHRSALERLRRRAGLSQGMVAQRVGVSRSSISAWERGQRPPLFAVRGLAAAYGVPVGVVARAARLDAPRLLDPRQWRPGDLAEALRTLRDWSGLTQRAVAGACGVSTDAVRSWESGRATPRPRAREALERAYGLPEGALLTTLR